MGLPQAAGAWRETKTCAGKILQKNVKQECNHGSGKRFIRTPLASYNFLVP